MGIDEGRRVGREVGFDVGSTDGREDGSDVGSFVGVAVCITQRNIGGQTYTIMERKTHGLNNIYILHCYQFLLLLKLHHHYYASYSFTTTHIYLSCNLHVGLHVGAVDSRITSTALVPLHVVPA